MPNNRPGFEKPVGAVVRLRLNRLRAALRDESPVGKKRQKSFTIGGKTYRYRKPPPPPGRLKKSWSNPNTVKLSASGKTIIITNPLPYARAQDQGANIPERVAKPGKFLMFRGRTSVFHKRAAGFRLRASNSGKGYVKPAVEKWKKGFKGAPNVRWAPFRGVRTAP